MNMSLDLSKLQLVLDGETDIIIRRDFTHPPARVWRALTEPALIQQWLGAMKRCEMDPRPGGAFHYEWEEFSFSGPILAVDAPASHDPCRTFQRRCVLPCRDHDRSGRAWNRDPHDHGDALCKCRGAGRRHCQRLYRQPGRSLWQARGAADRGMTGLSLRRVLDCGWL